MAYPPTNAPDRATGEVIAAAHINALDTAIQDVVAELGAGPKGGSADLTARLSALDSVVALKALADASNISASTWRTALGLVLGTDIYSKAATDALIAALSGTYVAVTNVPELEIVRVNNTDRIAGSITIMDRDPQTGTTAGALGAALQATPTALLYGCRSNIVFSSADDGLTWTQKATVAGYTGIDFLKVLADGTVLIVARNGAADAVAYDILSSSDAGATFAAVASQPLTRSTPFTRPLNNHSWLQRSNGDLYLVEYSGNATATTVRLLKSTDKGQNWTTRATFSGASGVFTDEVRHLHSVFEDPYVAGRLWVCTGDNGNNGVQGHSRIGFTDDFGTTWTSVTAMTTSTTDGTYQQSRAVGLMFTSTAVFWFADVPEKAADLYKYDRATHAVTKIANSTYPNSGAGFSHSYTLPDGTPMLLCALSIEPANQINRDDMMRLLGSADLGASWHEVMAWRRTQVNQTSTLFPFYFTEPDGNGAFWMTLQNADGGEQTGNLINLKMQPRPRRSIDRPRPYANHRDRFEMAAAEQIITLTHPDTAGSGTAPTTTLTNLAMWLAATDMIVVSFAFTSRNGVASSGSNYWTASLLVYEAGVNQTTIGQAGGASVAISANQVWTQLNANGLRKLKAGQHIAIGATATGAPVALNDLTCSIRLRRANTIV